VSYRPLIIYHGQCVDGFTAAWLYWLQLGNTADYLPGLYGEDPPDVRGRDVVIVDFSYPREVLLRMHGDARSLVVLDHHQSAKDAAGDLDFCLFNLTKSGCRLAQESAFSPDHANWLVDYVEDRDLWTWKLPQSRLVNAYIHSVPFDFDEWTKVFRLGPEECARRGTIVERTTEQYLATTRECSYRVHFDEYDNIPCVNAPYWRISELLNELARDAPFAVGWHRRSDGKYAYSLRSMELDVGHIAKKYGGGGHKNAAGFILDEPIYVTNARVATVDEKS
jgi:hypothetical protein